MNQQEHYTYCRGKAKLYRELAKNGPHGSRDGYHALADKMEKTARGWKRMERGTVHHVQR